MALPGMLSGLAPGGAPQGAPQLDDEQKRKLLEMLAARAQQGGMPQSLPAQGAAAIQPRPGVGPGMLSGMLKPGMALPGQPPGAPQKQAVPGAATPEQAAADRAEMLRKSGAAVGQPQTQQTGMFTPIGSRSAAGNIFGGDKKWFSGIFDTTERTSPFDSFYVNNQSSNTWL